MNALSPPSALSAQNRHRLVGREARLALIRGKNVDLCVWQRGLDPHFAAWCQQIAFAQPIDVDEELQLKDLPLDALLEPLPPGPERETLRDDVAARAKTFGLVLGCTRVRLQLHAVHHQHCPRFHVDSVGVRLITTYAGAATQWLSESDVVRERVGQGPATEVPVKPTAGPRQLECFDVALMKGRSWRGNRRFGVVHRSPPADGRARLVLTLDARG
jgi:hypothetical protein